MKDKVFLGSIFWGATVQGERARQSRGAGASSRRHSSVVTSCDGAEHSGSQGFHLRTEQPVRDDLFCAL